MIVIMILLNFDKKIYVCVYLQLHCTYILIKYNSFYIYNFLFFSRYNSGAKCFSQVHTKHLTVTIDAFTIHNSLWQGKKVNLPNKKDMPLVI